MEWRLAGGGHRLYAASGADRRPGAPEQMRRERRLVERWSSIYSRFNEVLAGIMTVKGCVMEEEEKRRFLQGVREGNEIVRRGVRTDNLTGTLRTLRPPRHGWPRWRWEATWPCRVRSPSVPWSRSWATSAGSSGRCKASPTPIRPSGEVSVSLETIFGILDADDLVGDAPGRRRRPPLRGEVEFRDVSFGYQPGRRCSAASI